MSSRCCHCSSSSIHVKLCYQLYVLQVPAKVLAGLIGSKLVLHPLIGLASLLAALHAGLLPADTDPLMLLVMLLVWCPPTAVLTHSLATMLQVWLNIPAGALHYCLVLCSTRASPMSGSSFADTMVAACAYATGCALGSAFQTSTIVSLTLLASSSHCCYCKIS